MDVAVFSALLFVGEFIVLFFLSQRITQIISLVFLRITGSNNRSILLLALLFLPGVILHETAHYLTAKLFGVHAQSMEFFPRIHANRVKLGSVSITRTDPIRRFLIGVSPVLFGLGTISLLFWFYFSSFSAIPVIWKTFLVGYAIFEISTTMFSSKKDLEGSAVFGLLLIIVLVLFGVIDRYAFSHTILFAHMVYPFINQGIKVMAAVLLVDGLLYVVGRVYLAFL